MIKNEDAYYTGYYRNVRDLGAIPALVFDTICGLIRDTGIGEIANSTLMELLGIKSKRTLIDAINKIIEAGYVEKKNGDGRGNKCIYYITEKGAENVPFMGEKGCRKYTKRVQILHEKGAENAPINKVLNKELNKESDGVLRETQNTSLSNTTTTNFENMKDFAEFWELFGAEREFAHEKENCEKVWSLMPENYKSNLLQQLRNGKRYRVRKNDNPYWYLQNYNGEQLPSEMPYMRHGTVKFDRWCNDAWKDGKKIALIMYEGSIAYCLMEDLPQMQSAGAEYLREYVEYKD